jgi:hypothetical protein
MGFEGRNTEVKTNNFCKTKSFKNCIRGNDKEEYKEDVLVLP